jgi:hypothetical protein
MVAEPDRGGRVPRRTWHEAVPRGHAGILAIKPSKVINGIL